MGFTILDSIFLVGNDDLQHTFFGSLAKDNSKVYRKKPSVSCRKHGYGRLRCPNDTLASGFTIKL